MSDDLAANAAHVRAILDTVGEGIITIDARETILFMNGEAERIWGIDAGEYVGRHCHCLMPERYKKPHSDAFARHVQEGARPGVQRHVEVMGLRKDGSEFPLELRFSSVEVGGTTLYTSSARDITRRKQNEAALRAARDDLERKVEARTRELKEKHAQLLQSEKLASLGQLVAGVAHEINTPLGSIKSNNDTLSRAIDRLRAALGEGGDAARVPKLIESAASLASVSREAIDRIATLVFSLRSFARLDRAELDRFDVREGLDSTLRLVRHELKHRITVEKDYGDVPSIDCFAGQVNQVFMNVLVNASQAIEGEGSIRIAAHGVEDGVEVTIEDSGRGIDPAHLPRIFDPGFTTKGVGVGTGLGLSIVHQIVERHGGRIHVTSEPGRGTRVSIRLPKMPPPGASEPPADGSSPG